MNTYPCKRGRPVVHTMRRQVGQLNQDTTSHYRLWGQFLHALTRFHSKHHAQSDPALQSHPFSWSLSQHCLGGMRLHVPHLNLFAPGTTASSQLPRQPSAASPANLYDVSVMAVDLRLLRPRQLQHAMMGVGTFRVKDPILCLGVAVDSMSQAPVVKHAPTTSPEIPAAPHKGKLAGLPDVLSSQMPRVCKAFGRCLRQLAPPHVM